MLMPGKQFSWLHYRNEKNSPRNSAWWGEQLLAWLWVPKSIPLLGQVQLACCWSRYVCPHIWQCCWLCTQQPPLLQNTIEDTRAWLSSGAAALTAVQLCCFMWETEGKQRKSLIQIQQDRKAWGWEALGDPRGWKGEASPGMEQVVQCLGAQPSCSSRAWDFAGSGSGHPSPQIQVGLQQMRGYTDEMKLCRGTALSKTLSWAHSVLLSCRVPILAWSIASPFNAGREPIADSQRDDKLVKEFLKSYQYWESSLLHCLSGRFH